MKPATSLLKAFTVFAVLLLAASSTTAQQGNSPGQEFTGYMAGKIEAGTIEKAFKILMNSTAFTTSHIYCRAAPSEYAWAFSVVYMGSQNPTEAFHRLFENAPTVCGKLYALVALYSLDRPAYHRLGKELGQNLKVPTMMGCIRSVDTLGTIRQMVEGRKDWIRIMILYPLPDYSTVVKVPAEEIGPEKKAKDDDGDVVIDF